MLEALQPGDVLWDTEIGGFYADRGARDVSLKLAVDVARGKKTVRRMNECGHALRHTYRTLSADAGVAYIAEMLVAHTLPGVGARYVHAGELDARLRAAQAQISAHILARVEL